MELAQDHLPERGREGKWGEGEGVGGGSTVCTQRQTCSTTYRLTHELMPEQVLHNHGHTQHKWTCTACKYIHRHT